MTDQKLFLVLIIVLAAIAVVTLLGILLVLYYIGLQNAIHPALFSML
jgi:hypothetical protein